MAAERSLSEPPARESASREPATAQRAVLWATLVMAGIVIVDQISKAWVTSALTPGDQRSLLPGVHLVDIRNSGVAFGLLPGGHAPVVVLIALAVVALVAYFATHLARPLLWLPTGLLLGGALGNLFDRVGGAGVVDFIKLPHWPAFNIADAAITVGALALLAVIELVPDRRGGR